MKIFASLCFLMYLYFIKQQLKTKKMKTIEKLTAAAAEARKGKMRDSLISLLNTGFARTGESGYSKGWGHKSIWTSSVSFELRKLNIAHETGNDAPRKGANGEFVKITSPALLKQIKERKMKIEAAEKEMAKKQAEIEKAEKESFKAKLAALPENKEFESMWLSADQKNASGLSWSVYRDELKKADPAGWSLLKQKFQKLGSEKYQNGAF